MFFERICWENSQFGLNLSFVTFCPLLFCTLHTCRHETQSLKVYMFTKVFSKSKFSHLPKACLCCPCKHPWAHKPWQVAQPPFGKGRVQAMRSPCAILPGFTIVSWKILTLRYLGLNLIVDIIVDYRRYFRAKISTIIGGNRR